MSVQREEQAFTGHSKIISALGDTLSEANNDKEEIIYAEVGLNDLINKQLISKPGEFELDFTSDRRPELNGEPIKRIE